MAATSVINLAGRSVNCRYMPNNRQEILDSRVKSTRAVGDAIAQACRPPRAWLQASTATIYAHRHDASNDQTGGLIGVAAVHGDGADSLTERDVFNPAPSLSTVPMNS